MKRVFDLSFSALGLVLLSPVFLFIAVAIKVTCPGPAFFRQERVGQGGRTFRIFKFRTMVPGARQQGALFTVSGDDRITAVGRFLRKFKLDELPQLLNVVRGEMSLVGPRPEVPELVGMFNQEYQAILQRRPGITHRTSILFRHEEEMLADQEDPEKFYLENIMPRKLRLYSRDHGNESLRHQVRTIVDTIAGGGPGSVPSHQWLEKIPTHRIGSSPFLETKLPSRPSGTDSQ